jgi:hypothetical protein
VNVGSKKNGEAYERKAVDLHDNIRVEDYGSEGSELALIA